MIDIHLLVSKRRRWRPNIRVYQFSFSLVFCRNHRTAQHRTSVHGVRRVCPSSFRKKWTGDWCAQLANRMNRAKRIWSQPLVFKLTFRFLAFSLKFLNSIFFPRNLILKCYRSYWFPLVLSFSVDASLRNRSISSLLSRDVSSPSQLVV